MGTPAGLDPLGRTHLPPPRRRPSRLPRRCRTRQTNRMHKGRADISPVLFMGREEKRPRPSVLPYGQNLDAGAIHLPRADKKKWGPRRVLTRWGGRTSRRPGEGHRGRQGDAGRGRLIRCTRAGLKSARPFFAEEQLLCAVGAIPTKEDLHFLLWGRTEARPERCRRDRTSSDRCSFWPP